MQIFLPYKSVYLTALVMQTRDPRRFNKLIIECLQVLNAIIGLEVGEKRPWCNHLIVKMYKYNSEFLDYYYQVFYNLSKGRNKLAKLCSDRADKVYPEFLKDADWYFDNFKKRLYTKDPDKYSRFYSYGESHSNYYYVNDKWVEYKQ